MHTLRLFLIMFVSVAVFYGCSDTTSSTTSNKKEVVATSNQLPAVTEEIMKTLWEKCSQVDFIFYELPVSMSQDDQKSVRQTLMHFAKGAATINKSCKALGRIFFQAEGEALAEAEIFFSPECKYYVFHENGQPKYTSNMTEAGIQFMLKVLSVKTSPAGETPQQ